MAISGMCGKLKGRQPTLALPGQVEVGRQRPPARFRSLLWPAWRSWARSILCAETGTGCPIRVETLAS